MELGSKVSFSHTLVCHDTAVVVYVSSPYQWAGDAVVMVYPHTQVGLSVDLFHSQTNRSQRMDVAKSLA